MTAAVNIFEVGGAVRDELMGTTSSDVDFAVEGFASLDALVAWVGDEVGEVVKVKDQFLTVRAVVRKGHPLAERTRAADFVLCRKDSATGDGRRPDFVEAGTIFDDLARRDFTVNAIAKSVATGEILDPHNGRQDIEDRVLRFVGDPITRITEDGMRVLRGLRFMVTKGLTPTGETLDALGSTEAVDMLAAQKVEPMFEEVRKMMRADTLRALDVLGAFPNLRPAIFRDGHHLDASLAERK